MNLSPAGLQSSVYDFRKQVRDNPSVPVIVAEGDSWFGYPRANIIGSTASNLVEHIAKFTPANILRLETNGATAAQMMNDSSELYEALREFQPDILLFSGGGNDILGESLGRVIENGSVHPGRFAEKMAELSESYERLIDLRDNTCSAKIITHGYDYPIPGDKPAKFLFGTVTVGPWIYPQFVECNLDPKLWNETVRILIDGLNTVIDRFHGSDLFKVELRGTLFEDDWRDEIHPEPWGFLKLAQRFRAPLHEAL